MWLAVTRVFWDCLVVCTCAEHAAYRQQKKTKTKHVGTDRVARVFFVSQFAHADCGCADADTRCVLLCLVWCGVGLALATHARKLARMH